MGSFVGDSVAESVSSGVAVVERLCDLDRDCVIVVDAVGISECDSEVEAVSDEERDGVTVSDTLVELVQDGERLLETESLTLSESDSESD